MKLLKLKTTRTRWYYVWNTVFMPNDKIVFSEGPYTKEEAKARAKEYNDGDPFYPVKSRVRRDRRRF